MWSLPFYYLIDSYGLIRYPYLEYSAMSSSGDSVLKEHSPPGNLQDLTPENRKKWSDEFVSMWMDNEIQGKEDGREPLSQFFNGTKTPFDRTQKPATITWIAFPKLVGGCS